MSYKNIIARAKINQIRLIRRTIRDTNNSNAVNQHYPTIRTIWSLQWMLLLNPFVVTNQCGTYPTAKSKLLLIS